MRFAFEDKETVSSFTVYLIAGIKIVVTGDRPGGIARKQLPLDSMWLMRSLSGAMQRFSDHVRDCRCYR
jgi:hypothetical protein